MRMQWVIPQRKTPEIKEHDLPNVNAAKTGAY